MVRVGASLGALTLLLAGCIGYEPTAWHDAAYPDDTDLDGIPDTLERALGLECVIAGVSCTDLDIEPPRVGVRDAIFVQYGRSGAEQDWRLEPGVWQSVDDELYAHGVWVQVADLGVRDDVDPEATWDHRGWDGRYWFTWLRFAPPDVPDSAGYNEWNLIEVHVDPFDDEWVDDEQVTTLLHEIYHAWLGDLRSGGSACHDAEFGGRGHSPDPDSILYTSPSCEQQEDPEIIGLGEAEVQELSLEPFENLRLMNGPDWF